MKALLLGAYLMGLLALVADARAQTRTDDLLEAHLRVQGRLRNFLIYVPTGITPADAPAAHEGGAPLLLVLHGRLGTPSGMVRLADFRPIANREGVILVYPEGVNRSWNDGRENTPSHRQGIDDVAFIDQLITYMIKRYPVNAARVYVTGMSNGGFMTSTLGCALGERIAAIAVVAASIGRQDTCEPTIPLPVMYIQGTKDPVVPYTRGKLKKDSIYSHQEALDHWIAIDGCAPKAKTTEKPDSAGDGTSIIRQVYVNAKTGIEVVGITVQNGGHAWPGGWAYLPKAVIGTTSKNLDANEVIWAFCKKYKRTIAATGPN
jgi:polyhydroxybutyrate depolymerase